MGLASSGARSDAGPIQWRHLEAGLDLARVAAPSTNLLADQAINILRIDTDHFRFRLLNASAQDNVSLTPRQWSESKELVAVINASMFQEDLVTSVSMMRTHNHINNAYRSKDKAFLAFDPVVDGVPDVKIIDQQCDDFDQWSRKYKTLIQSIRMISCTGKNVWRPQVKKWSTAAIGVDSSGKVLFIQTEAAFSTHDLINTLLQLPLNITQAMYVEGGPQAQLYVASEEVFEFVGQISPIFYSGGNLAWPLPNVVGISRKNAQP